MINKIETYGPPAPEPISGTEVATVGMRHLFPHPDGKPWSKCCAADTDNSHDCQCFMKKPRRAKSRFCSSLNEVGKSLFPGIDQLIEEDGRFFCCHRTDGGFHRECAGWAKKMHREKTR